MITVKGITDEDFVNYKKPSMFISFPKCSWKCEKDCGQQVCQNSTLATADNIQIDTDTIVERYMNNPITSAVVCGGLEPLDSWNELQNLIKKLRERTIDDIVIYTGYKKEEIIYAIDWLCQFPNVIIKFGRYIPGHKGHYDDVLCVTLASENQYAERIS